MALVLPAELLHVGYAAAVREFLLREFADLTLVSLEEKVFPGALQDVVIVLGEKKPGDGRVRVCRLRGLEDLECGVDAVLAAGQKWTPQPGERWGASLPQTPVRKDLFEDVLRKAGTEAAFSGELLNNKGKGDYVCAGCGAPLFASDS